VPVTAGAQVVGQGKTAGWATLGLVARFDGSGELRYVVAARIHGVISAGNLQIFKVG
jgi:hypothetical protein